jgi:hypothetical protein
MTQDKRVWPGEAFATRLVLSLYKIEFTPRPEPDPLAVKVFIELNDRPSRYLNDDVINQLTTAAKSCRGAVPTPELINFFALADADICEKASSVKEADGELANTLCWFAIQRDHATNEAAKWFDGCWRNQIDVADVDWILPGEVGGYLGRLALAIRKTLHEVPEFVPHWFARQRLAERIERRRAYLREHKAELIARIHDLPEPVKAVLTAKYFDRLAPKIVLDTPPNFVAYLEQHYPDPERARKQLLEECTSLVEQVGILASGPDSEGAITYWLNRLRAESPHFHRAEGGGWITNLPLATVEQVKHLDKTGALEIHRPVPAAPTIAASPEPTVAPPIGKTGEKGKARKKQTKAIVDRAWLIEKLQTVNAEGKVQLKLKPTPLARNSPARCLHAATWRKLLNGEPVRNDVAEHLIPFFKHFGISLKISDIPLKYV